jgi:hypothetical protein
VNKSKVSGQFSEETPVLSAKELLERTAERLSRLGGQIFAVSPYSQYYDDWLVNLRQVVAEFESNSVVNADEVFTNERAQIFSDVSGELAKRKIQEDELNAAINTLTETNHLIVETDTAYATQNREIAAKRNNEIERLTKAVHDLEGQLDHAQKMKTSFFKPSAKKNREKDIDAVSQKLIAAKSKLETAVQNFAVEQEKLHDQYEKKKQEAMERVRILEKEITDAEIDTSLAVRQATCDALHRAAKALLERKITQP